MKKRILAGAILCVACLLILSACGQGSEKTVASWQEQYDLGVRYLSEGNYEEAIIAFSAAIEIDPKRAPAYVGRGDAYVLSGETEENLAAAQSNYETAIELDAGNPQAHLNLAKVYVMQGNIEAAISILETGIAQTNAEELELYLKEIQLLGLPELTDEARQALDWFSTCMQRGDYATLALRAHESYSSDINSLWYFRNHKEYVEICYDGETISRNLTGIGLKIIMRGPTGYVYYGSIIDGMPNGNGKCADLTFWALETEPYAEYVLFEGSWKDGKPEGWGVWTQDGSRTVDDSIATSTLEANWVDGLAEGEVLHREYLDGRLEYEYQYACVKGKPTPDDRWTGGGLHPTNRSDIRHTFSPDFVWRFSPCE